VAVSCLRHGPQRRIKLRVKDIASLVLASGKHFCDRSARCGAPNADVLNSRDALRHQMRKVRSQAGCTSNRRSSCWTCNECVGCTSALVVYTTRNSCVFEALTLPDRHYLSHRQQPPMSVPRSRCFDTLGKSRCPRAGRPERHRTFLSMNLFPCSPRTDL
jgi:hypothetical protein